MRKTSKKAASKVRAKGTFTLKDITDKRERSLLQSLKDHLMTAEMSLWEAGDIINTLKEEYPERKYTTKGLIDLIGIKRWPQNRLDELASTARAYPRPMRDPELTFSDHLTARKAAKRGATGVGRHLQKKIEPNYAQSLKTTKALKVHGGKNDVRNVTKTVMEIERKKLEPQRLAGVAKLSAANTKLLDKMHFGDFRTVMKKVTKGTVKLINLDPPYADYDKTRDGVLYKSSASVATDCDHSTRVEARKEAIDALKLSVDLLAQDGVIVLWQAALGLPWEISKAIDDFGLQKHPFLIWDKNRAQLGDASNGVMYSTEIGYVLTRQDEEPISADLVHARQQIIECSTVLQRAENFETVHLMQKPQVVNEDVLRRFTAEGDTILDAFGCSASMCIAAEKMGRRWIYSESNAKNFALGKRNMENHLLKAAEPKAA